MLMASFQCTGTSPFARVGMGQVLPESPNASICSVSQVSWFWQAFPQIVVRWVWTSANSSVFKNRPPSKCRSDFGQSVVQKWDFIFFGRSCPINTQEKDFWTLQFLLSPRSAPIIANLGNENCLFLEVSNRCLAKMPPNTIRPEIIARIFSFCGMI